MNIIRTKPLFLQGCLLASILLLQGCALTKVVTTPLRVAGTVVGVVPVVGDVAEAVIDTGAATIDLVPL